MSKSSSVFRRPTTFPPNARHLRRLPARDGCTSTSRRPAIGGSLSAARPVVLALVKLAALPLVSAAPLGLLSEAGRARVFADEDAPKPAEDPSLWIYLSVAIALVLLGGAFAGLTIALMGQDETYLQVIATSGDGPERKHARRVLNLIKKGKHWVLVTLLLSNVITNETLPIVLDRSLGGGWPAVVSSTVLIVIFGEIVPQSICVRYGLSIGAYMAPCVLVLMYIMFPVAWPTAKLLDYLLGEDHGTMYKKAGLKTLVQLHKTLGTTPAERLMEDEVTIINSVLDLKDKPVGDIMTPMGDVFTMSADTVLDERMMDTILSQGYSRIPVYAPDDARNFIGMLLVKILITYDPEDCKRIRDFALATLPETSPYTSCLDIINFFQEGKSHMVLVSDFPGQAKGALGVVTLEDVIEELIGEEIIDESDVFVDVHKAIRRLQPAPRYRFRHPDGDTEASDSEYDPKEHSEESALLGPSQSGRTSTLQAPKGTLLNRRKSSTESERTREPLQPITVRNTPSDLRKHLSHLGPGNPASKPRATKFSSVKIKPGVDTIPEGHLDPETSDHQNGPDRPLSPIVINHSGQEHTALLDKGGKIASDGVVAVQAGYGATDVSSQGRHRSVHEQLSASEASRMAWEHTKTEKHATEECDKENRRTNGFFSSSRSQSQTPTKLVYGHVEGGDTIGEMEGPPSRPRSKSRQKARSGSITQTEVEGSGGMKKIVLDISSSSEEPDDTTTSGNSSPRHSPSPEAEDGPVEEDDPDTPANDGRKRRKKRGKKKKTVSW